MCVPPYLPKKPQRSIRLEDDVAMPYLHGSLCPPEWPLSTSHTILVLGHTVTPPSDAVVLAAKIMKKKKNHLEAVE